MTRLIDMDKFAEQEVWGVVFYAPPPRWKQWLARLIPWYEPHDTAVGASTKRGDIGAGPVDLLDHDTIKIRWFANGEFEIDDE